MIAVALGLACAGVRSASASGVVSDAHLYEGKRIRSITFTPADYPLKASRAIALLPFSAGSTFHARQLREAIQSLYATGRYTQILVDAQETPGGIALRFATTPAYFVGHVAIHDINAPPNQDQLLGAAKLALGTPFEHEDGVNAAESMTAILRNNGFYSAHVETQTEFDPATAQASIEFFLHPGKRARYAHPEFGADAGLPASELIRASRWQRLFGFLGWDTISDARTRQGLAGIRQLYDKRGLLEADVRLAGMRFDRESNAASPELSISPGPHVSVTVNGAHLPESELRRLLPIYQESKVDDALLEEGARNLENYFQSQGFFDVRVTHKTDADRLTSNTSVDYSVVRGPHSRFVHLEIRGNRYFDTALIQERLAIQPAKLPRYPHGRFSDALLVNDVQAIENLYAANGFREVSVTSHLLKSFRGNPRQLGVEIDIKEGPQSRVAQLAILGPNSSDLAVLTKQCSSSPGQPFSETALAADREMILNYYYDRGYPYASFQAGVGQTQSTNQVSLRYEVTPGPQRFVERVIVTGLETTRPDVVLRRIELHSGDPLSLSRQTESQRKLYNLGVFARVNSAVQNPAGDEISKVLLFDIGEAKHYSFNAGVGAQIARIGGGVTTLDNPAGTTGFAPRLTAGLTRDNFLGLGQQIGLQTALSTLEQRVALTYFIPEFTSNPNLSLTSTAVLDSSNDVRTYTATRREASVQLGERLSKAYTVQYRLVFRNVTLGNLKIDRLLVPLLSQPETVGVGELSFIADRRDDPTDAHHGSYTTLDVAYAPGFLGSQTIFGRVLSKNSTYYQLTRDLVFARSTQFGVIWRAGGRPVIPLAERLYSGGSTSLRAFPDFQAGPRDLTTGFPLGGNALFINNLELRFPLYGDNISGVIFQDAGNVYDSIKNFSARFRQENLQDFGYMVQDVGLGIRYRTPVGPIRVDLSLSPDAPRFFGLKGTLQQFLNGTAMSTVQKINAFQFHISLGQAF